MFVDTTKSYAEALDAQDDLARFRDQFHRLPDQIYLDGNSLGLLSKPAEAAVLRVMDEWKMLGIDGWTEASSPWFSLAEELGRLTAPLIGAEPDEVVVTNSTTVNLHQILATLCDPNKTANVILSDGLAFPSDAYALQSHLKLRGLVPSRHLRLVPSSDGLTLDENQIIDALTPDVQLVMLPAVIYTSGQILDMARLTQVAHEYKILIGFDCSHSIGAVPHAFDALGIDFAFWCGYKYLNGGPGAAGGLYLNRRHFGSSPGLAGWFSSDKRKQFDMTETLTAAYGAGALQIGTPNILSMAPLLGTLPLILDAGMDRLRVKSLRLTEYLMGLVESELGDYGFSFGNPREDARRGGHVALVHPDAVRLCKALKARGIVPDYRAPNIVRLAPVPLYTSFGDVWEAVQRLKEIMQEREHEAYENARGLVA